MTEYEAAFQAVCGWASSLDEEGALRLLEREDLGIPAEVLAEARSSQAVLAVSPCLLGVACKYDGGHNFVPELAELLSGVPLRLVCPEVLAGFGVPRPPIHFLGGDGAAFLDGTAKLVDRRGRDRSAAFLLGVRRAALLAPDVQVAVLKDRSPSCGLSQVHVGEAFVEGRGAWAALLGRRGTACFSETQLGDIAAWIEGLS